MHQDDRYVRWFETLNNTDVPLVGGKNASLGEMVRNLKDHGIDLAEVGCVFDAPMVTVEDEREKHGEQRLQSLGWFRERVVFLVWTERNESARVISCRYGDKHETRAYFEALDV